MARSLPRFVLLTLLGAASAHAELYRWTDARGITHYTSDINQVPASQRELARKTVPSGKGSLQRIGAPAARSGAAQEPAAPASPRRATDDLVDGKDEAQWREEATRLRARVALHAGPAERCQGDRLRLHARSSRAQIEEETAEAKGCERTARELALAQRMLSDFEERAHRLGVPPGWIRE